MKGKRSDSSTTLPTLQLYLDGPLPLLPGLPLVSSGSTSFPMKRAVCGLKPWSTSVYQANPQLYGKACSPTRWRPHLCCGCLQASFQSSLLHWLLHAQGCSPFLQLSLLLMSFYACLVCQLEFLFYSFRGPVSHLQDWINTPQSHTLRMCHYVFTFVGGTSFIVLSLSSIDHQLHDNRSPGCHAFLFLTFISLTCSHKHPWFSFSFVCILWVKL